MLPFMYNFVFIALTVYTAYNCVNVNAVKISNSQTEVQGNSIIMNQISQCKAEVQANRYIKKAIKKSLFRCACIYKLPLGANINLGPYTEEELNNCSPSMIKFRSNGHINEYLNDLLLLVNKIGELNYEIAVPLGRVISIWEWCEKPGIKVYNYAIINANKTSECIAEVQGNSYIRIATRSSLFKCACLYKLPLGASIELGIYTEDKLRAFTEEELHNCSPSMIKFPSNGYINEYLNDLLLLVNKISELNYKIAVPLGTVTPIVEWCEQQKLIT